MTDNPSRSATAATSPEQKQLTPAAKRALAEAEARRKAAEANARPLAKEFQGPKGPEPTRYGDWENKGIASDFSAQIKRRASVRLFRFLRSFRGASENDQTRNLGIARCAIAHLTSAPSDHPGLTVVVSVRHHHRGADRDASEQVADIRIQHPDAAIGDEPADRTRRVRAADRAFSTRQP